MDLLEDKVDLNELPQVRECGNCTLCCKLLLIPEFNSPANAWCPKCDKKNGCTIYEDRPENCRIFRCLWLLGFDKEKNRPDKSKMVLKLIRASDEVTQLQIYCDIGYPHVWSKNEAVRNLVNIITELNGRSIIICGQKRRAIGKESVVKVLEGKVWK